MGYCADAHLLHLDEAINIELTEDLQQGSCLLHRYLLYNSHLSIPSWPLPEIHFY